MPSATACQLLVITHISLPGSTAICRTAHWPEQYPLESLCRGVICLVEVVDGSLQTGDKVASLASGETYDVSDVSTAPPPACKLP